MVNHLRRSALSLTITVSLFSGVFVSNQAQACSADPMLASMCVFAGNYAPRGFAFTDGQLLSISANSALFSLLGATYGGDGRTNFALPDTRGRSVIGARHGPGLSNYALGQKGGVETVTLIETQIPTITPTATAHAQSAAGNNADASGHVWAGISRQTPYSDAAPNVTMNAGAVTVNPFGGGEPHENRSPFIAMNWIIATEGTFPPRN
jgi:microcystin-dependent protein